MVRSFQYSSLLLALACTTLSHVSAQDAATQQRQRARAQTNAASPDAGKLDDKTTGSLVRVSQLMGMNIQNPQGESVGEISDIVLDARTGQIRYAAVTYGGFLGLGDKLFAVPFKAFKIQVDPDDRDEAPEDVDYVLVLNVTQEQLEGHEGFDQDHWPNMADQAMAQKLDELYGVNRNEDAKGRLLRRNRELNQQ